MPSKNKTPSVFVTNLPQTLADAALQAHFSAVAPVKRAFIVRDPRTRLSRGFGYVQFAFEDDAVLAAEKLNGTFIGGIVGGAGAGGGPSAASASSDQKPIRVQVSRDHEDKEEKAAEEKKKKEKQQQHEQKGKKGPVADSTAKAARPAPSAVSAPPVESEGEGEAEEKEAAHAGKPAATATAFRPYGGRSLAPGALPVGKLLSLPLGDKMKKLVVFGLPADDHADDNTAATAAAVAADANAKAEHADADSDDDDKEDAADDDDEGKADGAGAGSAAQLRKALWKRVRKLPGVLGGGKASGAKDSSNSQAGVSAGMQWGVRLEGNRRLTGAVISFDRKDRRDKALAKLEGHTLHGHKLTVRRWEEVLPASAAHSTARLIVRNLRFTATAAQIARAFARNALQSHTITHVHLPAPKDSQRNLKMVEEEQRPGDDESGSGDDEDSDDEEEAEDGGEASDDAGAAAKKGRKGRKGPRPITNRGFAFVEFVTRSDASKALAAMAGGKRIDKRVVAVDWVLTPEAQAAAAAAAASASTTAAPAAAAGADDADDADKASVSTATSEDEAEAEAPKDDAGDEEAEADEKEEGDSGDEEDGEEEGAGQGEGDGEGDGPQYTAAPVEAGSTVFIRNVPFDATENDLYSCMRAFGPLKYARLVMERDTGRLRGTAFAQFHHKESADRALEAAGAADAHSATSGSAAAALTAAQLSRLPAKERKKAAHQAAVAAALAEGGVKLLGRTLQLSRALPKAEAEKLTAAGPSGEGAGSRKVTYDKRHLYLQWEGHIRPDSELGKAMPPGDAAKRESAAKEKKTKLASPLFFVSPVRLSIRNLAKHVDDAALYKLCLKAARIGLQHGLVDPNEGDPMLRLQLKPWPRPMAPSSSSSASGSRRGDDEAGAAPSGSKAPLKPILRDGPFVKVLNAKVMREGGAAAILAAKQRAKEERLAAASSSGGSKMDVVEEEEEDNDDDDGDDDDDEDERLEDSDGDLVSGAQSQRRGSSSSSNPKGKRDSRPVSSDAPRSKGYGFITFEHHMHALACLRQLNNNPEYSKDFAAGGAAAAKKPVEQRPRLIVEFSVEDWRQVKKQEKKREDLLQDRAEKKAKAAAEGGEEDGDAGARSNVSGNKRRRPGDDERATSASSGDRKAAGNQFGARGAKRPRREEEAAAPGAGGGRRDFDRRDSRKRQEGAAGAGSRNASGTPGFVTAGGPRNLGRHDSDAARGKAPATGKAAWDARVDKVAATGFGEGADAGGRRKERRLTKKKEAKEDADHDRLVAEYKAKLFG